MVANETFTTIGVSVLPVDESNRGIAEVAWLVDPSAMIASAWVSCLGLSIFIGC